MVNQEEIHNQCLSNDPKERIHALEQLHIFFTSMPEQQAWNDLHRLTNDEDSDVRSNAASALGFLFSQLPDKQQAWNDLHRLTNDEENDVRKSAAKALDSAFSDVPDQQQAWNDLHTLTNDKYKYVRSSAASALGFLFSQLPDKQQAWNDLHALTNDKYSYVKNKAAKAIGSAFSQLPDKQQAWNDLHRLTNDEDGYVRSGSAGVLCSLFSQLPDKQQAWNDLHRLTMDKHSNVRSGSAGVLCSLFSQLPDKQQAWNDLHRLTNDIDSRVMSNAASALGSAFSQLPDKQQAWNDLYKLTSDEDSDVRTSSNHSLGKVSIFLASQAKTEEDYKKELEKAIDFFETAAKEASFFNPAQFCLPFYRSFHTLIFKKQEAMEEVSKYMEEAKVAIKDSESKKQLFEAVENLAKALTEVQNLGNLGLEAKKSELNFYRKYCDRAAELMNDTNEKAPYATGVLRKGLPILDRNLKEILEEIQKKTKNACKELKGTSDEETACNINRKVKQLIISNPEEAAQLIEDIAFTLKNQTPNVPEYILSKIDLMISENDFTKKIKILEYVIGYIIRQMLEENKVSIVVHGNENNFIVNSEGSNISVTGDTTKSPKFLRISKLILEHPIISTIIGGIILAVIQKKYFS